MTSALEKNPRWSKQRTVNVEERVKFAHVPEGKREGRNIRRSRSRSRSEGAVRSK